MLRYCVQRLDIVCRSCMSSGGSKLVRSITDVANFIINYLNSFLKKKLVHVMYPLIIRLLSVWNLIYYNSYLSLQNHVICFQWTCPRPFPLLHIIRFCWSSVFFAILGVALFFSTLARIHICFGPRVRLIGFDIHICTKQFWRKSCLNELGSGVAFAVLIPRISHHLAC